MILEKTFKSPAKVNFFLHVVGEREDGYHFINSLMSKVSLFDFLKIRVSSGDYVKIKCPKNKSLEREGNLIYKASRLLLKKMNVKKGVDVELEKNIPIGSGLGGGSSNAATVLKGLNSLLKFSMTCEDLSRIGSEIGSDVPFFIYEGTAIVEGVGEKVKLLSKFPKIEIVILSPKYEISTASVYKMIKGGLTRGVSNGMRDLHFSGIEVVLKSMHNDLEQYALKIKPGLAELKNILLGNGALKALISGSGSSIFGIFADNELADRAFGNLEKQCPGLMKEFGNINVFRVTTLG